ncbi:uncharacterized protein LOC105444214 [Strongylocentrotus purpuratus]|uniref:Uncharacterized protein n=1 Tax=Strongylocentrotus purpuratus TaxID=7668 RepID=A0A7M7MYC5_STRPU|nr:uncharacterized protein LOC105444214 [Strongylocentrotus purpuratus]
MKISYYILVLIQLLSTINYGLGASGGGTPISGVVMEWQEIVSTHLCPLIACEGWCDCTEVESNFIFAETTVDEVSPECFNKSFSEDGKLKLFTDCDPAVLDSGYFRWWPPSGGALPQGTTCLPHAMAGALLERVRGGDNGLYWKVCLTADHCLNVSELCTSAPQEDSCSICNRGTNSATSVSTPRLPGEGTLTTSSSSSSSSSSSLGPILPSGLAPDSGCTGFNPVASIIVVGILLAFVALYGIIITLMYLHLRRSNHGPNTAREHSVSCREGQELDPYTSLDATTMKQPAYEDLKATRDGNRGHTKAIEEVDYENQTIVKQTDRVQKSYLGEADGNNKPVYEPLN